MRFRTLERLMYEWQAVLSLRDWEIELILGVDEDEPEASGTVDYDIHERTATIHIRPRVNNQEVVLVHELLHIVFAPLTADTTGVLEEQAVESLSKAFVALKERCNGQA